MILKTPLELPVFWENSENPELEKLGIKTNYEPEVRMVMFYNVDVISRNKPEWSEEERGVIIASGLDWTIDVSYDVLVYTINKLI